MNRRILRAVLLLAVAAFLPAAVLAAQEAPAQPADPGDVGSIEAIVSSLYDVISGPAGAERDWDRMRSLFAPEAKLIPSGRRPDGGYGHRVWTIEEYIAAAGPQLEQDGFFEVEIHNVTEEFGTIAHVFSTYESRRNAEDVEPFVRGINSIQLADDGDRWWILNVFWTDERTAPIPSKYLP